VAQALACGAAGEFGLAGGCTAACGRGAPRAIPIMTPT